MKFKEGDVVNCTSKIKVETPVRKNGTVWMVLQGRYFILDTEGFIHDCPASEVGEEQK